MADPVDNLPWNEKTIRHVRAAIPPGTQVYDAVDVMGRDPHHQQIDAALLVLDSGLLFVRTRIFGKPTTDHLVWDGILGYEFVPGQGICVLETHTGQWLVMPGGSFYEGKAPQEERNARFEQRLGQLFVVMDTARSA
jgi:hypothetical protein